MAKTPALAVRMDPDVREALQRHADADSRSLSSLIGIILREWLEKNPLPKSAKK